MRPLLFLIPLLLLGATPLGAQDLLRSTPTPISPEDREAFQKTLKESQKGDLKSMGTLGLMYEKGLGTAKDLDKAFHWFSKGAKKGDAACENNLGFLYLNGLGVQQNEPQALKWFQKAADQGLASAQGNLGLIYGRGLGVKKDYTQAIFWFKKAAEQNDSDAQVNLAQMLSLGEGAPKDLVESHKWFSLALRHPSLKDEEVVELRGDIEWLERRMTNDQISESRKRASTWEETPAVPTTQP